MVLRDRSLGILVGITIYGLISCCSFAGLLSPFVAHAANFNPTTANRSAYTYPQKRDLPWKAPEKRLPRVQLYPPPAETDEEKALCLSRREEVKKAFLHSWAAWQKHFPNSGDPFGWEPGTTYEIDVLDTLWIMGLEHDWERIVSGLKTKSLKETRLNRGFNVYEGNVRIVGSLLANYEMTGNNPQWRVLWDRALELTRWYHGAFDTHNGIPMIVWDKKWYDAAPMGMQWPNSWTTLNQLAGFALEFAKLTELTADPWYWEIVLRNYDIFNVRAGSPRYDHHLPNTFKSAPLLKWDGKHYGLGRDGNEFYAHLPKLYALMGGANEDLKDHWKRLKLQFEDLYLFRVPNLDDVEMLIVGTVERDDNVKKFHKHLSREQCSAGATMGLLGKVFGSKQELGWGPQITEGCLYAAERTPTNITPQECILDQVSVFTMKKDDPNYTGIIEVHDKGYYLGSETFESLFYMWRITGDRKWQNKAWNLFRHITDLTKTEWGYQGIKDVFDEKGGGHVDQMRFEVWMGRTLKYAYLIFEEWDVLSLDQWVFNARAHPLRRMDAEREFDN
ncbi:glycoside hydrolase [Cladorrhinum sp. PSN332]|nr:glycoside hydrolase [Cladorrhinum sp. PSN332]